LVLDSLALRHTPAAHEGQHVIAGHLHPVFHLHGKGRQSLRLPCFHSTEEMTILPAFGDFTGGQQIDAQPGHRIFVTDGGGVWPIAVQQVR